MIKQKRVKTKFNFNTSIFVDNSEKKEKIDIEEEKDGRTRGN